MSLISGNAIFGGDAVNCSSNSISGLAVFFGTAVNDGDVASAVFNDGAVNLGSLTSGTFLGTAVNSGVVTVGEFFGTSSNEGVVVEAAKFADTSSNVGTVSGSAIFADSSVSDGIVEGAVQIGIDVTQGENQALTETPTSYSQADGFFPNAHYSSGSKTAPADYATVVHQVGNFWYKYDGNGDGSLANGEYNDGTSSFVFVKGIKGAAYINTNDPDGTFIRTETLYITINGTQYENGTYDIVADGNGGERNGNNNYPSYGTVFYSVNNADINISNVDYANGTTDYIADGNGSYTENVQYPADGTLFVTENYYSFFSLGVYQNGTVDKVADGSGGYRNVENFEPDNTKIGEEVNTITIDNISYNNGATDILADGIGGAKFGTTNYPISGTVIVGNLNRTIAFAGYNFNYGTKSAIADGSGSYSFSDNNDDPSYGTKIGEVPNAPLNLFSVDYANGTRDVMSTGSGAEWGSYNYPADGTEFTNDGTYRYLADGMGGYRTESM